MSARVDHVVVPVPDLDAAVARWSEVGPVVLATAGDRRRAVLAGPGTSRVELREGAGAASWVVAVEDLDVARDAARRAGFDPGPVAEESWTWPDGRSRTRVTCEIADREHRAGVPSLVACDEPWDPGPATGPVVQSLEVGPAGLDGVAALLRAVGLRELPTGPGAAFGDGDVVVALTPTDDEVRPRRRWLPGSTAIASRVGSGRTNGLTTLELSVASEPRHAHLEFDGLWVSMHTDDRAHRGHVLQPDVEDHFAGRDPALGTWEDPHPLREPAEADYSVCRDPGKYRIIRARVEAWADALTRAGLAGAEAGDTLLRIVPAAPGALAVEARFRGFDGVADNVVELSVGGVLLETLPDCGCDACDSGSADLLREVDELFLHVLDGGLLHLADGAGNHVTTTLDGWSGHGGADFDAWLEQARRGEWAGRVVRGAAWL